MLLPFDDLDAYFERTDRALVGPVGLEEEIQAIFHNGYQAISAGGQTDVSSSLPSVVVKNSDVTAHAIVVNTRIFVDGRDWFVRDPQPDGMGMTRLFLYLKTR
jgi:hypothetical protein